MTNEKKYKKFVFSILLILLMSFLLIQVVQAVQAQAAEPGSEADPLVTKGYVDMVIDKPVKDLAELQNKYNQLLTEVNALKQQPAGDGSKGFEVVTVEAACNLISGNGTEIVLRSGAAKAIHGEFGDLSDITSGKDLPSSTTVLLNHLLISSRDDGRGLFTQSKCFLLVRGAYKIVENAKAPAGSDTAVKPEVIIKGTVNASTLNVREKADTASAIVATVVKGEIVTIISKNGGWYNIKISKNISGWALGQYITIN